jgi:hypothetical protein
MVNKVCDESPSLTYITACIVEFSDYGIYIGQGSSSSGVLTSFVPADAV